MTQPEIKFIEWRVGQDDSVQMDPLPEGPATVIFTCSIEDSRKWAAWFIGPAEKATPALSVVSIPSEHARLLQRIIEIAMDTQGASFNKVVRGYLNNLSDRLGKLHIAHQAALREAAE